MNSFRLTSFLVVIALMGLSTNSFSQKITVEEIISKHLDSIATKENRDQIKNQIVIGDATVKFKLQSGLPIAGKVVFVSENNKNFVGMKLNSKDYPSERFSFDGKNGNVDYIKIGTRSILGSFILTHENLLEDGLLSGTLSSAWALLDPTSQKKAKISFGGMKKIDGNEAYVLEYSPKGGSDLNIKLFFDKETFRHIRTEYKRVSSAGIGQSIGTQQLTEGNITLIEEFSDFKAENNLNLPHKYRINYATTGQSITTEIEWLFTLSQFTFNQNLHPDTFIIDAK